jgi:hypothetical protein
MSAAAVRTPSGNRARGSPVSKGGMGYPRYPKVGGSGTFYAAADTALSAVTWCAVVHVMG